MSDWFHPLLPQNQTRLEAAIAHASALTASPERIAQLWDVDRCPELLLPWLAWALSVDDWDERWDAETKRRVVAASIDIHRRKGSVAAVRIALSSIGHDSKLIEWWQTQPAGVPHTFVAEVEIRNRSVDGAEIAAAERQIDAAKPVRSHYRLRLVFRGDCLAKVAATLLSGDEVTVYPYRVSLIEAETVATRTGMGVHDYGTTSVYPAH